MLPTLFDHMAWADAEARTSIAAMPDSPTRDRAVSLYAHIVAIEHAWAQRFAEQEITHASWPDWSLDTASAFATSSAASLRAVAGSDRLSRVVKYRSRSGDEGQNLLWEILAHVVLHGTYHRGQIALLARDGGGVPASTDFSMYLRVAAPPQP